MKPYFSPDRPRVLAHRGFAADAPENTLLAFAHAVALGADYLETDARASRDGVAVLSHDADLGRLAARRDRVSALSVGELRRIDLGSGQAFTTLADALDAFPGTRFNIDVKSADAAWPVVAAVRAAAAVDRVLITSFSERRRAKAVRELPGVATSASAAMFARALVAGKLGFGRVFASALREVDAVQIPERALGLDTVTPRMLAAVHNLGVEVHVWTINDEAAMLRLFDLGVDGIVTDRPDLALALVRRRFL